MKKLLDIYDQKYRKLMVIPVAVFVTAVAILLLHYSATGEFFQKDISLKGGVTITVVYAQETDVAAFEEQLTAATGISDITVRALRQAGQQRGLVIDAGVEDQEVVNSMAAAVQQLLPGLKEDSINTQVIGSTLGRTFAGDAVRAVAIAFVLMSLVVLLYFRNIVPSLFVIWAAAADIISTLAVIVLLDVKVSTAGFAAFLMLIGYSVDTDILLTTRMLKGKEPTLFQRLMSGFRTGVTMTLTAFVAVFIAFLFTQSDTIRQIMLILSIGLLFDLVHTWLTNALVLRWWLERKGLR